MLPHMSGNFVLVSSLSNFRGFFSGAHPLDAFCYISSLLQAAPRGDVPIICTSAEAFWARDRDTVCARPHQFAAFRQAVQGDDVDEQAGELEHLKPCVTTGYRNIDKDGGETVRLLAHGGWT